jgi:hypothetical protein
MEKAMSGTLASLSEQQTYPRMAKPEDFKASGGKDSQDGTEPKNVLEKQSYNQMYPRCNEDGGMGKSGAGMPSTDRTAAVSKAFKIGKSDAESGTSVKVDGIGVDLKTGMHASVGK